MPNSARPPVPRSRCTIITSTRMPALVMRSTREKSIAKGRVPSANALTSVDSNATAVRVSMTPDGMTTATPSLTVDSTCTGSGLRRARLGAVGPRLLRPRTAERQGGIANHDLLAVLERMLAHPLPIDEDAVLRPEVLNDEAA